MGSQAKECRKKMTTILTTEIAKLTINDVVKNFMGDTYVEKITKAC
jgi:ribosomal protein S3AE